MKRFILTLAIIYTCTLSLVCMETKWPRISDMEHLIPFEKIDTLGRGIRKCACEQEFNSFQEIKDHVERNHTNDTNTKYDCPKCTYKSMKLGTILVHFASEHTHEVVYICFDCNIACKNVKCFNRHLNLHKQHRETFKYLIDRQAGKQNGNREFVCTECESGPKPIATSSQIRFLEHIKRTHLQSSNSQISESPTSNDQPIYPDLSKLNQYMLNTRQYAQVIRIQQIYSQAQTNNQEKELSANQLGEYLDGEEQSQALETESCYFSSENNEGNYPYQYKQALFNLHSKVQDSPSEPLHFMNVTEKDGQIIISSESSDEDEDENEIISSDEDIELGELNSTLPRFNPRPMTPKKLPSHALKQLLSYKATPLRNNDQDLFLEPSEMDYENTEENLP